MKFTINNNKKEKYPTILSIVESYNSIDYKKTYNRRASYKIDLSKAIYTNPSTEK